MSAGDKVIQASIEGSLLERMDRFERDMSTLRAQVLNVNTHGSITSNLGAIEEIKLWNGDGDPNDPVTTTATGVFFDTDGIEIEGQIYIFGQLKEGGLTWGALMAGGWTFNGTSIDSASLSLTALGWIAKQVATIGANTRKMRMGMQVNAAGTIPETRIEHYEEGVAVTIPNGDFASLDMSNWTQSVKGKIFAALGTLDPAFTVSAIAVDSAGNVYAAISSGATTSSVWKCTAGTWAPLGTLSTSFNISSLVTDSSNNVYAGIQSGATTSSVYKCTSGTWAPLGTLSTSFVVRALGIDSSGNIFAGGSSFTTSAVYRFNAGAWAAYGTLNVTFTVKAIVVDSSGNVYATGTMTTSCVYKYSAGAWAPLGTLFPSVSPANLAIDGSNNIYVAAGALAFTTSDVWKYTSSWAALGTQRSSYGVTGLTVDSNNAVYLQYLDAKVYRCATTSWALLTTLGGFGCLGKDTSGNIYAGISGGGTSSVWKLGNENSDWDGSDGYAEVTSYLGNPEIINAARFAVTAGTMYQFSLRSWLNILSGSCLLTVTVKFYTLITGGSLVQTSTIVSRVVGGSAWIDHGSAIVCPATATYAIFDVILTNTNGNQTARVDDFSVVASNSEVLVFDDDDIWAELDGVRTSVRGLLNNGGQEVSVTGATTLTSAAFGQWHNCSGSSPFTVGLPTAVGNANKYIGFRITATALITLDGNSSETVDGITTKEAYTNDVIIIKSDGTNYKIVSAKYAAIGAAAYATAAQTIPNNTNTALTFNTDRRDDGDIHSTSSNTNRFTAPVSGWYTCHAGAEWAANGAGYRLLFVMASGHAQSISSMTGSATAFVNRMSVDDTVFLAAGEWIEFWVYQNSGGNLNIISSDLSYNERFSLEATVACISRQQ